MAKYLILLNQLLSLNLVNMPIYATPMIYDWLLLLLYYISHLHDSVGSDANAINNEMILWSTDTHWCVRISSTRIHSTAYAMIMWISGFQAFCLYERIHSICLINKYFAWLAWITRISRSLNLLRMYRVVLISIILLTTSISSCDHECRGSTESAKVGVLVNCAYY
jgi:hypothetical protein